MYLFSDTCTAVLWDAGKKGKYEQWVRGAENTLFVTKEIGTIHKARVLISGTLQKLSLFSRGVPYSLQLC